MAASVIAVLAACSVVVGLMALAVGVHEARTDRQVLPRLGSLRGPVRRHGRVLAALGAFIALFGLSNTFRLPLWFDLVLLFSALALAAWSIVTYRPIEPLGRKVDPPEDPDAVWKRRPTGY